MKVDQDITDFGRVTCRYFLLLQMLSSRKSKTFDPLKKFEPLSTILYSLKKIPYSFEMRHP